METYKDFIDWAEEMECSISGCICVSEQANLASVTIIETKFGYVAIPDEDRSKLIIRQKCESFCRRLGFDPPKRKKSDYKVDDGND